MLLEIVDQHTYLGTLISNDGKRNAEIKKRVSEVKSVSNEIVMILRTP
jgi:hypothetical protein